MTSTSKLIVAKFLSDDHCGMITEARNNSVYQGHGFYEQQFLRAVENFYAYIQTLSPLIKKYGRLTFLPKIN